MLKSSVNFQKIRIYLPKLSFLVLFLFIFIFAYLLLLDTVSNSQHQAIKQLSQQVEFPKTQQLALSFLEQPAVNKKQYFQLIRAFQYEKQNIKVYPALDPNRR